MIAPGPEVCTTEPLDRRPVAPVWHTLGLLAILSLITYAGVRTHGTSTKAAPAANPIRLYATVMVGEWALVFYVWRGIRRRGLTFGKLIGGNWHAIGFLGRVAVTAVLFWFIWEGSARLMHRLLGASDTSNVTALLPKTLPQVVVWCLVSCTAGFCEEILYRGYLQRQFAAWTGSTVAAIAIQAGIFGASHGYQGLKQVAVITVLGALYGLLAHWCRTLVPGMAAHAWSDIYGGWLRP